MTKSYPSRMRICALFSTLPPLLALACQTMPGDPAGGNANAAGNPGAGSSVNSPTLFVLDGQFGVTSYANALAANGNVAPVTNLTFVNDSVPRSLVVTRTGQLIVSRIDDSLFIFDNAGTLSGTVPPARVVKGDDTLFNFPQSLALDVANDRLFVAGNHATDGILVFDNVSSDSFDGNVAPSRTFSPDSIAPMNVTAMSLDSRGALFAHDNNTDFIAVFADAGALSGVTVPTQIFTSDAWASLAHLTVDVNDVLYVVDRSDSVFIFRNASTLNGDVTPDSTLIPKGDVQLNNVVVAPNGRGFLSDNIHDAVISFANIASRSGSVAPDATIVGSRTEIHNPFQLFLAP